MLQLVIIQGGRVPHIMIDTEDLMEVRRLTIVQEGDQVAVPCHVVIVQEGGQEKIPHLVEDQGKVPQSTNRTGEDHQIVRPVPEENQTVIVSTTKDKEDIRNLVQWITMGKEN